MVSVLKLWEIPVAEYRTAKHWIAMPPWMKNIPDYQTEVKEWDEEKDKICAGS